MAMAVSRGSDLHAQRLKTRPTWSSRFLANPLYYVPLALGIITLAVLHVGHVGPVASLKNENGEIKSFSKTNSTTILTLQCPTNEFSTFNFDTDSREEYLNETNQPDLDNVLGEGFRHHVFDGWELS